MKIKIQPLGKFFKVTFFVGSETGPPDSQIAQLDRSVRCLRASIGLDPTPEETSRRNLIYQEEA